MTERFTRIRKVLLHKFYVVVKNMLLEYSCILMESELPNFGMELPKPCGIATEVFQKF